VRKSKDGRAIARLHFSGSPKPNKRMATALQAYEAMKAIVVIDRRGRFVFPKALRRKMGLVAGSLLRLEQDLGREQVILRVVPRPKKSKQNTRTS
jgi:AbrB family looped-hinge helix DNA binding protein